MYDKCFYFLLNSRFFNKNGVSEKIKAYFLQYLPALSQLFSPHLFNFIQKTFSLNHIHRRGHRLCILYQRLQSRQNKTIKILYDRFFIYRTGTSQHLEKKLKIRWKMTYLNWPLYFWPKFTVIWVSSHRHQISSEEFHDTLRSIFFDCFWGTIFCSTQKMYVSEYLCKTCLKELGILLKCRETFAKLLAA